jgi:hypothetical protein
MPFLACEDYRNPYFAFWEADFHKMKGKKHSADHTLIFSFLFLVGLEFKLRGLHLQSGYCLSHTFSPFLLW